MSDRIPGTRVPDNALHRASLWLEDLKQVRDGEVKRHGIDDAAAAFGRLVDEIPLAGVTDRELLEGAQFYATNLREMVFGRGKFSLLVMGPSGAVNLEAILLSAWIDGFEHGAATTAGKRGESNEEIVRRATAPDG